MKPLTKLTFDFGQFRRGFFCSKENNQVTQRSIIVLIQLNNETGHFLRGFEHENGAFFEAETKFKVADREQKGAQVPGTKEFANLVRSWMNLGKNLGKLFL